jgi:hypothetical protein
VSEMLIFPFSHFKALKGTEEKRGLNKRENGSFFYIIIIKINIREKEEDGFFCSFQTPHPSHKQ